MPVDYDPHQIAVNNQTLIDRIERGELTHLDGAKSPQTLMLAKRFGAAGIDMTELWVITPQDWRCPACGRSKVEQVRLDANRFLRCRLVEHHDHVGDWLSERFTFHCRSEVDLQADGAAGRFAARAEKMVSAYDRIVICDDCNTADAAAKASCGAPKQFSFSAEEIGRFVRIRANRHHEIDPAIAVQIWEERRDTFELRARVVDRIAKIAASNQHWFQPFDQNLAPDYYRNRAQLTLALNKATPDTLTRLAGRSKPIRNLSAWRTEVRPVHSKVPTDGDINHLVRVVCARAWAGLEPDWQCAACGRNKVEVIRPSNDKPWFFSVSSRTPLRDVNALRQVHDYSLCGDCAWVAEQIGVEARNVAEIAWTRATTLVTLDELRSIIAPHPHNRHAIRRAEAGALTKALIERLRTLREENE